MDMWMSNDDDDDEKIYIILKVCNWLTNFLYICDLHAYSAFIEWSGVS